jgi:predicted acylesterase/phospholipase RssA
MIPASTLDPALTPKRLLSIDGGGVRGIIAAEVLLRIEEIIEKLTGNGCLADHFHLIGGTSTGAILAAGLALGMRAKELRDFYLTLGPTIFKKERLIRRLWHQYQRAPLAKQLRETVGETTGLGSDRFRTLLVIVSKNVTTASAWFFTNNPQNPYFPSNRDLPLWQILRASTAAPTYFAPETIRIPDRKGVVSSYEFVDGGVSTFNNPAFQVFLEATHANYKLGWQTGPDKLLLVSVGTGFSPNKIAPGQAAKQTLLGWARYGIRALMDDTSFQQNVLLQLMGETPRPHFIDRELGTGSPTDPEISPLSQSLGSLKLFTYHRYTVSFSEERLSELGLPGIDPQKVSALDSVAQVANLQLIGQKVAAEQVQLEDYAPFFPASQTAAQAAGGG